jgi:hypothetical protein
MKKIRALREVLAEAVETATKTALLEALAQSGNNVPRRRRCLGLAVTPRTA